MKRRVILGAGLLLLVGSLALGQGRRGGGGLFGGLRAPAPAAARIKYDGRFTFVRLSYQTLPGGYWYRGDPAWSHGYPTAEQNLVQILHAVTGMNLHNDTAVLSLEDPEIFKFPVLYLIEVSWWQMTDAEAVNLRRYLDKGGFVIVDDFKTEQWNGGRGWAQFADNMKRVMPQARFVDLDVSHPIFHSFFDITSLEIFPQAYNAGRPVFRGLFENNDPSRAMRMFVNYNTDISQFWEWSGRGLRSIDQSNEAYKLGVNAVIYGLLH